MEATSFWGREGEGAATDKMEETFISQPSKECGRDRERESDAFRELWMSSDNI